jgi:hypothetical protein
MGAKAVSDHVFISYSRDDGAGFVERLHADLGRNGIATWVDTNEIGIGDVFPDRLQAAVREARAVLVVLTPAAVLSTYVAGEWHTALNRFTPILPLLVTPCELPVGLGAFQFHDFSDGYAGEFHKLVERLRVLDDVHLPDLKRTLEAFRRIRSQSKEPRRYDEKIAALKAKLAEVEGRVDRRPLSDHDLVPAAPITTRTTNRRCRRSGKPPQLETSLPFRDRVPQQEEIAHLIADAGCRLVSVIGRGGVGKSALALAVLDRLTDDDAVPLDGIAALSSRTSGLGLRHVFEYCAALVDEPHAGSIMTTWGNQELTTEQKIDGLFKALSSAVVVILLDNIEDVLDAECKIGDHDLRQFVELSLRHRTGPTLLVTSRVPIDLPVAPTGRETRIKISEGLPEDDAVAFLRDLDPHGDCGIRTSSNESLRGLAHRVHGVPRALEVAKSLLAHNPNLNPDDVAKGFYSFNQVVERVVEENYRRLDADSRRVLEAAAVFRRPVPPAALAFLLEPFVSHVDVLGVTARLARAHALTIDRVAKTVSLHPIDSDYAYSSLVASATMPVNAVERRAAAWYRLQRQNQPPAGSTILQDFENQLLEFDHLMRAGAFEEAMDVFGSIDNRLTWSGQPMLVRQMLASLQGKLATPRARMQHATARGDSHLLFGELAEGRAALAEARELIAGMNDPAHEARIVSALAGIEKRSGNIGAAVRLFEEALPLTRAAGDTEGERYRIFDLALLFAGRRHAAGLTQYALEMSAFAARMNDSVARALAATIETLARLARSDWPGAYASAQSLFELYRGVQHENWLPAVDNMAGLAAIGMRQWDTAISHLRKAFSESMAAHNFQYATRSAFNLAWAHYRERRRDRFFGLIEETATLSGQPSEMAALESLTGAVKCANAMDPVGQARALLACAAAVRGEIDLWDASDIARDALSLAQEADAVDVVADASAFLESRRLESGAADTAAV